MYRVKVSAANSKLGAIPAINMPAVITCRPDAPCVKDCYACKGNFRFANVRAAHLNNLKAYQEDPEQFADDVAAATRLSTLARWHASGDIVDSRYLVTMCDVAQRNPGTRYLAFTKKFQLVNDYINGGGVIPANLRIVFSAWPGLELDNPHGLPVAYVDLPGADVPADAIPCAGKCPDCGACWYLPDGGAVVFHKH